MSERASTYQAGIDATEGVKDILAAYATHYGHVELCLYAEMRKSSKKAAASKNGYLVEFGIAARHFNAIARNLEGKIDSVKGLLPPRIQETELAIARAKKGNLQIQERKQGAPEETQAFQSGDQA